MSRLDRIENRLESVEKETKKKKFKLPFKVRRLMKLEPKRPGHVLVQYLTRKYQVRWLLQPVVSGDIVVIDNKPHTLNPKTTWRYGKSLWYIIREIDRKPVSNLDYNLVKKRGDDTEADAPLIKAVLGAIQKKSPIGGKNMWIGIIVIIIIAAVLYLIFAG